MKIKWLKKYLPNCATIKKSRTLKKIPGLQKPSLWLFNRGTVSLGVAVGLFVAILPIPMQMLIAALFTALIRANLPIAVLITWISNPITFLPITYLTYYIGTLVLGEKMLAPHVQKFEWHWNQLAALWPSFISWLSQFGKAFFIGLPILAISVALVGYVLVIVLWQGCRLLPKHRNRK